jgi:RNA polymerase sigma factor (sigma-70 family)
MKRITDKELIKMLSAYGLEESRGINYLLDRNMPMVKKYVYAVGGKDEDVYSVVNDATVILVNNIRKSKYKEQSSISTYFVGICKLLWKNRQRKQYKRKDRFQALDSVTIENLPEIGSAIDRFEKLNENKTRLERVYSLITGKCKEVLNAWSCGFSMKEIAEKLGYKNSQIAMNKKNTCLKTAIERLHHENI